MLSSVLKQFATHIDEVGSCRVRLKSVNAVIAIVFL